MDNQVTQDTFITFFILEFRDNKDKIWYFLTTHPGNLIISKRSSHFVNSMMNSMNDDSVDLFHTQFGGPSNFEIKFKEGWCSDSKYMIHVEITNIINHNNVLRYNTVEIEL